MFRFLLQKWSSLDIFLFIKWFWIVRLKKMLLEFAIFCVSKSELLLLKLTYVVVIVVVLIFVYCWQIQVLWKEKKSSEMTYLTWKPVVISCHWKCDISPPIDSIGQSLYSLWLWDEEKYIYLIKRKENYCSIENLCNNNIWWVRIISTT
jgi:hypothetical protein